MIPIGSMNQRSSEEHFSFEEETSNQANHELKNPHQPLPAEQIEPHAFHSVLSHSEEEKEITGTQMNGFTCVVEATNERVVTTVDIDTTIQELQTESQSHSVNLRKLESVSMALANIRNTTLADLWKDGKEEEALALGLWLTTRTQDLQVINLLSPRFTMQDLAGIASFVVPPVETFYINERNGEKYWKPNSSELLGIAQQFLSPGEYAGLGLSKDQYYLNLETQQQEPCDIVYMRKKDDQINYEECLNNGAKLFFHWLSSPISTSRTIPSRIIEQGKCAQKAKEYFDNNIERWRYKSFLICNQQTLIAIGLRPDGAKNIDAVVFYHQKYKKEGV